MNELTYIRTSFCKNLHAKCYLNEENCIITSLNLYEFGQVNNNEMGVAVSRADDMELYQNTYEEAQRIIRISDEIRISLEKINANSKEEDGKNKFTTSKLAKKLDKKTEELTEELIPKGYLIIKNKKEELTEKGKQFGESKKGRFGTYFLWKQDFTID